MTMGWRLLATGLLLTGTTWGAEIDAAAKARLLEQVKHLASDDLEGRGVGTTGLDAAAKFVRTQFESIGLNVQPVNGDAFQKFDLITGAKLVDGTSLKLLGPEDKTIDLQLDTDFKVCSFGGAGEFRGELVFCGYGIEDPESKYNDFEGIDVEGKVVMIMRRNPQQGNSQGPFTSGHGMSRHAELRTKLLNANQHKAAAILFVNDSYALKQKAESRKDGLAKVQAEVTELAQTFLAGETSEAKQKLADAVKRWQGLRDADAKASDDELMPFGYAGHGDDKPKCPVFHITQAQADVVLKAALKTTVADLEAEIDKDLKPHSAVLPGWTVQGAANIERTRSDVSNVIAILDGTGPLAEETIVVGAHYDHVGRGGEGSLAPGSKDVHNGADDNASGTVALIELARRLAARPEKLPRKVMFIAFTAEELGLLGSAKYVNNPVVPLEQTIAMFNMDMVGRLQDDKLTIFGTGTSPRWEPELKALNESAGFKLSFKPEGFGPSDHSSFYGKKIPVLHFFTGNHPDYHRPSDDWEKLNLDGTLRVVDMLEKLIVQTATTTERPAYIEVKQAPMAGRGGNRPYFGTIPDFSSELPGYSITGAAPGSPAEKGGLKGGDRIVSLGGNKITGLDDFDLSLRKFKPGEEVAVIVVRDGQEVTVKVILDPPR